MMAIEKDMDQRAGPSIPLCEKRIWLEDYMGECGGSAVSAE